MPHHSVRGFILQDHTVISSRIWCYWEDVPHLRSLFATAVWSSFAKPPHQTPMHRRREMQSCGLVASCAYCVIAVLVSVCPISSNQICFLFDILESAVRCLLSDIFRAERRLSLVRHQVSIAWPHESRHFPDLPGLQAQASTAMRVDTPMMSWYVITIFITQA